MDVIAGQLGVSRTPVKEALGRLSSEGLIDIHPRRGTFVAQITADDIRENFEVREALEMKACELLEGRITPEQIAGLREMNERLTSADISLAENALLDSQFHRLLVDYTGNRRLMELHHQLNAHVQIARIHYRSDGWRSRLPLARREHGAILDALEAGRREEARLAVRDHIRASMKRIIADVTPAPPLQ